MRFEGPRKRNNVSLEKTLVIVSMKELSEIMLLVELTGNCSCTFYSVLWNVVIPVNIQEEVYNIT